MLILLPPSETKRDGGTDGSRLDLAVLSFPELGSARRKAIAGLRSISKSISGSMSALHLGPTQRFEIDRNRALSNTPTMPAIERYTGVLYDAMDVAGMSATARAYVGRHVVIHSALFGLVAADDPIPAYRFSHDTRVPGTSLTKIWSEPNSRVLSSQRGLVLDLRSESYVHLGAAHPETLFVRVVSDDGSGKRRALNHFNKHGKGELVRTLAEQGGDFDSLDQLLEWAERAGIRLLPGDSGELDLVV